ncbi:MAG: acetolactate synthase small subunit [Bacteroidales bacterium]|nr:acetolactate synthase small subunit [Bacteroidales bacterium]
MDNTVKNYTVSIFTENQIGLLAQISNVFTRRNLSIWSLSAGASSIEGIHNITIITEATERRIREAVLQIEKRVDVVKAFYYTDEQIVYRELALYKVPTDKLLDGGNLEDLLSRNNARIVEMNRTFTVIQKTGHTHETQRLYEELQEVGVLQFVRSGRIALSRSSQEPVQGFLRERQAEKERRRAERDKQER